MLATHQLLNTPLPRADEQTAIDRWRVQAEGARLHLTRVFAGATHVDVLPSTAATQMSAKLSIASRWVQDVAIDLGLTKLQIDRLAGLTLMVLHHAWGTRHNGVAGDRLVPLEYHPDAPDRENARVESRLLHEPFEIRAMKIVANGRAERSLGAMGTIAHESVHEAQYNTLPNVDLFSRQPLQPPPPDHARSGYLFMSTNIPMDTLLNSSTPPLDHPLAIDHYLGRANEIQARLEGSQVSLWAAEHERDHGDGKLLPASVLAPIIERLTHAAAALGKPVQVQAKADEASTSASALAAPSSAWHFGPEHAAAYEQVMRVLDAVADVRVASASRGWSEAIGEALGERLADRLPSLPLSEPVAVLADLHALADMLDVARQELGAAGVRIGMRDRVPPIDAEFADARRGSLKTAVEGLRHFASKTPITAQALVATLFAAIEPADFHPRVQLILTPGLTDEQREVFISDTVTVVAARLLGVPPAAVPRPGVMLYDAPNEVLPKVDGLNTDAGQARKIRFVPESWQLFVPRHSLRSASSLAASLARRSFDVAYTADLLRIGALHQDSSVKAVMALRPVEALLLAGLPLADQQRLSDPGGPADLLRAATLTHTSATSTHPAGRWFQEGPRARLKAEAAAGDPASRDHYRANAAERWKQPAVALGRALASLAVQSSGMR